MHKGYTGLFQNWSNGKRYVCEFPFPLYYPDQGWEENELITQGDNRDGLTGRQARTQFQRSRQPGIAASDNYGISHSIIPSLPPACGHGAKGMPRWGSHRAASIETEQ